MEERKGSKHSRDPNNPRFLRGSFSGILLLPRLYIPLLVDIQVYFEVLEYSQIGRVLIQSDLILFACLLGTIDRY